jgi:hydrogenase nickel incorporation protein HypA/HybF
MHEFSICRSIVAAVEEELSRLDPPPKRLAKVRVVVGRMHQIVPEYLVSAYQVLTRESPANGSGLEIAQVPVTGRCRACQWEGEIQLPVFRCGACGAFEVDLAGGKELYLDHLEVET